ncbi:MAG: carbamate kinase [Tissierellia bacterium]|jgi:carbamate kinase|nr:carbamate kinase [Tissierellia bacterium]
MNKKIVVALGGNALGDSPEEQKELVKETSQSIVKLIKDGYEVIVGHGNGPQVGMINLSFDYSHDGNIGVPNMPFPECGAMSQGYIGYHMQQALKNALNEENIDKEVCSIVTQVVVDKNDESFSNPTKPIGQFYSKEESEKLSSVNGHTYEEDSGRGYRRVVPSPTPIKIVELETVKKLSDMGTVVITVGGGGIPVIEEDGLYKGVAAVIDKDKSCSKLASDMKAGTLLILTAVEQVAINFNKPNQENLSKISVSQVHKYIEEEQFAKGSMLPKIEACLNFLEQNPEGKAIITSLEKSLDALNGKTGTIIYKD